MKAPAPPLEAGVGEGGLMSHISASITRGFHKGKPLYPHKHKDGKYVATTSRYEEDYIRVDNLEELRMLIQVGCGARMSNPETGNAPSFITNTKIRLENNAPDTASVERLLDSITDETDLDRDSKSKSRKEQSLLRAYLLRGSNVGRCVICCHEFPFDMLVAAHLKKRSECTVAEKKDFKNVAALMCKTGCDDLYENGYITVDQGTVVKTAKHTVSTRLSEVISNVVGNDVENWAGSISYYIWHQLKFTK